MKFTFLGDVHCDTGRCREVCFFDKNATVIQVGDLGVGWITPEFVDQLPDNFYFFPGNHDNRQLCKQSKKCLGDYGERFGKFFFVSGAYSIDREDRVEGVSIWSDEELSYSQSEDCLNLWEKSNVDVLVAHDVPQSFTENYMLIYDRCMTRNLLQRMIEIRKPKLVISGHHHKTIRVTHDNIVWVGLKINEAYNVEL